MLKYIKLETKITKIAMLTNILKENTQMLFKKS